MKIATCLTANGAIGTPFEAASICVFERGEGGWEKIQSFDYFPVPDMGVTHARLLLQGIASLLQDCEVFLLSEMRGYAHVWLCELGFRAWKSEGTLFEQLDSVAAQDALSADEQIAAESGSGGIIRGCGGGGCSGACGSDGSGSSGASATQLACASSCCVPAPEPVGDASARRYRIDLAAILDADPSLNSRQVLLPVLEKRDFASLEVCMAHTPKWFAQALERFDLEAVVAGSGSRGLVALVSPRGETRGTP